MCLIWHIFDFIILSFRTMWSVRHGLFYERFKCVLSCMVDWVKRHIPKIRIYRFQKYVFSDMVRKDTFGNLTNCSIWKYVFSCMVDWGEKTYSKNTSLSISEMCLFKIEQFVISGNVPFPAPGKKTYCQIEQFIKFPNVTFPTPGVTVAIPAPHVFGHEMVVVRISH